MQSVKLQVEIRFTPILDFGAKYKPLISPYLRLANFSIQNFGAPEESCVLVYKDEPKIRMDLRWDRIIYVANDTENPLDPKSPIIYYFEIFEKLKGLDSFGMINDYLVATWHLIPKEESKAGPVNFSNEWFNKAPQVDGFQLSDAAIVYETANNNDELLKLQFGPFKSTDPKNYGLENIEKDFLEGIKKGVLAHTVHVRKKQDLSLQNIRKMHAKIVETIELNFINKL